MKLSINIENRNENTSSLQGSLISPILFDLYINELYNNSFDVLANVDDLCILWDGKNQLIKILNIID